MLRHLRVVDLEKARFMSKRTVFTIALLTAACTIPIHAQNQNEEGELNFSMGGGLSVPLNSTANYVGV
jgi:hypothetical protein